MARTIGSSAANTWPTIRAAAIQLIARHGFEAMTLRQLSTVAGLTPGALYNYAPTKHELLFKLLDESLVELIEGMAAALVTATAPLERLRRLVAYHVHFHIEHRDQCFIGNMELRSLTPPQHKQIVALRDRYERAVNEVVIAGRDAGVFDVADAAVTSRALITMLSGICFWYRDDGRLCREEIIDIYMTLVLRMLGVKDEPAAPARKARRK